MKIKQALKYIIFKFIYKLWLHFSYRKCQCSSHLRALELPGLVIEEGSFFLSVDFYDWVWILRINNYKRNIQNKKSSCHRLKLGLKYIICLYLQIVVTFANTLNANAVVIEEWSFLVSMDFYVPSVLISGVSNSLKRVREGPICLGIFSLTWHKLDTCM